MPIAIIVTDRGVSLLKQKTREYLSGTTPVWVYPDIPAPEAVEMAVVWKHPAGILNTFPNLKLVSSLGAGVEQILADKNIPPQVAITRIVDGALLSSMRNYVLMAVLNIHKQFRYYQHNQREMRWEKPEPVEIPLRIGLLGLGQLGAGIAQSLVALGFELWGYSLAPRQIEGVRCMHAENVSPADFASNVNLLICLLPLTKATEGILNIGLFRKMPRGSYLINVARGAHLREDDLLQAMKEGRIREAWLDVFREEPLPPSHPFWLYDSIIATPHIASITNQDNAARIIAENYVKLKAGEPLLFEVSREKGY